MLKRERSERFYFLVKNIFGSRLIVPGVSKKVPLFDWKWKRSDKISEHSKYKTRFVNLQLRCTYLAFLNRPPNTKDTGSQGQNLECTRNQRFCEMA